jgi:hypothetical protein
MNWLRTGTALCLAALALLVTGCPKLIPGTTVRIEDVHAGCTGAVFRVVAFQENEAIGIFDMEVNSRGIAEFVIPQAVAQRVDFTQPVKLTVFQKSGPLDCFLAGRNLIFTGTLKRKGTDPRTGNPVYVLNFWEDFKIEYR